MKVINGHNRIKRVIATVMSFIMVVSLLAGVGVLFSRETEVDAATQVLDYDTKTFNIADDEFMVLEVVPDSSMAQFGYLVGGQEPVDITRMDDDLRSEFYNTYESESARIFEFQNRVDSVPNYEEYVWMGYTNGDQYGEYEYVGDGKQEYDVVKDDAGEGYVKGSSATDPDTVLAYYKWDAKNNKVIREQLPFDRAPSTDIFEDDYKYFDVVTELGLPEKSGDISDTDTVYTEEDKTFNGSTYNSYITSIDYKTNSGKKYTDWGTSTEGGSTYYVTFKYLNDVDLAAAVNSGTPRYRAEVCTDNGNSYSTVTYEKKGSGCSSKKTTVSVDIEKHYKYENGKYVYYESPSTSYKYVRFVFDNSGRYIVDDCSAVSVEYKDYNMLYTAKTDTTFQYVETSAKVTNNIPKSYVNEEPVYSNGGKKRTYHEGNKKYIRYDLKKTATFGDTYGTYKYATYYHVTRPTGGIGGDYRWVGMRLNDSYAVVEEGKASEYNGTLTLINVKLEDLAEDEKPSVKAKREEPVEQAYYYFKANDDKFKKFTLGMAYIDNDYTKGQDVDYFQFRGWYYEPECVNAYVEGDLINDDTVVYADWLQRYGDETSALSHRVIFDDGVDDEHAAEVTNMPFSVFAEGSKFGMNSIRVVDGERLVAPDETPSRTGYFFTGWYSDSSCVTSSAVNLKQGITVTEDMVLYAGWREIATDGSDYYRIQFAENLTIGQTSSTTGLTDMPSTITGPALYVANGTRLERPMPSTTPKRTDGYLFAGWYLEPECRTKFEFGDPIIYDFTDNLVTLYARWVKAGTEYTLKFVDNKPRNANEDVTGMPAEQRVQYGNPVILTTRGTPKLQGNVEAKLDSVSVRVVTVTPKDLAQNFTLSRVGSRRNGESLIKRADFIVINETCDEDMRQMWGKARNMILFPQPDAYYECSYSSATDKYTFKYNSFSGSKGRDLQWDQTLELFTKLSGSKRYSPCPIMFDYAIYNNITKKGYADQQGKQAEITISTLFSDGGVFSAFDQIAYSNNIYKLYLLSTQANPITLYNAYFIKKNRIDQNTGAIITDGTSNDKYEGGTQYWNEFTLIPFNVLETQEWYADRDAALETIGLKLDVSLNTGGGVYSALHNRFYIYGYENAILGSSANTMNFIGGYLLPSFSTYVCPGGDTLAAGLSGDGAYSPAQVGYHLLKNNAINTNFTTSLNILEIEPCDVYKTDDFWFWYISRCIPNYLGSPHVTGVTSSEFNGMVGDIANDYDIVYFGVNDKTLNRDLLFNVDDYTTSTGTERAWWKQIFSTREEMQSKEFTIEVTQTISVPFEKYVEDATVTEFKVSKTYSSDTPNRFDSVVEPIYLQNGTLTLNKEKLGVYADWFGLSPYAKTAGQFLGISLSDEFCYTNSGGKTFEFAKLGLTSSNGVDLETTYTLGNSPSGRSQNFQHNEGWFIFDSWKNCYFTLQGFYWGAKTTTTSGKWIACDAGTVAYAGEKVKFKNLTTNYNLLTYNYVYTHVGPSLLYQNKSTWSKIGEWFTNVFTNWSFTYTFADYVGLLGTLSDDDTSGNTRNNDTINSFLFSGNDITLDKYNELYEYATVGHHPIVVGRDVLKHTTKTRSDGTRYDDVTVNERMIDSSTNIYKLLDKLYTEKADYFFETHDSSKDVTMAATIQKYAFSIDVQAPVEYTGLNGTFVDGSALEYTIRITTNSGDNANYSVALYVDTNADGRYSPEDEIIESPTVIDLSTGFQVPESRLKAGTMYKLTADIGDDYKWAVAPWKLVVTNLTTRKQSGVTGKVGIQRRLAETRDKLYVLQIVPNNNATLTLPTQEEINSGSVTASNNLFYKLTKDLPDYKLITCRKSISGMSTAAASINASADAVVGKDDRGDSVLFSQINMIILGCGVNYDISNAELIKLLQTFVASGKPVIFTFDSISYVNMSQKLRKTYSFPFFFTNITYATEEWPSNMPFWGYQMTKTFREALSMDRFDAQTTKGKVSLVNSNSADKPYKLNARGGELYTLTGNELNNPKERALVQGFSNTTVAMHQSKIDYIVPINDGQITTYPYMIDKNGLTIGPTHAGYYQLDFENDDVTVWYCLTSDRNTGNSTYHTSSSDAFYYGADARNNYYLYTHGNLTYSGIGATGGYTEEELKLFINTICATARTGVKATVPIIVNNDKAPARKNLEYLYIDYDATIDKTVDGAQSQPFGMGISSYQNFDSNGDGIVDSIDFDHDGVKDADVGYYKRVYFTLKDYSILQNKKMVIQFHPAEVAADGSVTKVGNTALALPVYECDENGVPIGGSALSTYSFKYNLYDSHGNVTATSNYAGKLVETGKYYYVDVPISDAYYKTLLAGDSVSKNFKALDGSDKFVIKLQVITRFGDIMPDGSESEVTSNAPLVGTTDVCIMRRGLFSLD